MEEKNNVIALTVLGQEFAAAAGSRVRRFDQLGSDAAALWSIAMVSPTVYAGMGYQAAAGHMPPRQTEVGSAAAPGAKAQV